MNIPVLIPAFNPDSKLLSLVADLIARGVEKIVVVNDGSSREHEAVFDELRHIAQCHVLRHAVNLGKGAALKTGFNHLLVHCPEARTVITADADGQHAADDILRMVRRASELPDSLLIGARTFQGDVPLRSLIGNSLTRFVFRVFTGLGITDTQTGLRAWPRALCAEALRIELNGYDFEMESLVRAKQAMGGRFPIVEVPIQTIYLQGNKSSHFNPIMDSMRIYFVFIRYSGAAIVNALVDNLVFTIFFYQTQSISTSQVMGRLAAVMIAFVLARNVVFNSSASWRLSLVKFLALVCVMGLVSYGAINYLHVNVGVDIIPAKLMTEGLLFLANFAIQRDFIFARKDAQGTS